MVPSPSSSLILFCLTVSLLLLLLPLPSHCADPDPLLDLCVANLTASASSSNFPCKLPSEVTADDFVFDGLSKQGNVTNLFGVAVTTGNVLSFPGLNTLGLSMNRVDFGPGGINPPHSHPRASEIGIVIEGKILSGIVTTKKCVLRHLPGSTVLPLSLFAAAPSIPMEVLTKTYLVDEDAINAVKSKFVF
ncbi:germin-like protein subfamily T member 2 [Prunus yedoensis var. nudiflora]|uniref:Germin-like protein subfamily T member 2 n=1 Tax=Prunus yedoensis var. nudiflora TaxID=2094558 RepID=A0A314YIR0_PRUYE|nr:germin-like protein subfamily T member 2 [Prunus yedoensis var. nudiflora]